MGFSYNEALVEGTAVLATYGTTTLSAAAGVIAIGPFQASNLRRVVFDIYNYAAEATTSTCYVQLQGATTSGATYYTLTGADTTYPSLVTSSFTAGGTITTVMNTSVCNFVRFEYKAESIKSAIDYYNKTNATITTGPLVGPWLQLALNPITGTGTFAFTAVAYGVMGSEPSADINVNRFMGVTATTGALIATVACKNSMQYIDGWKLTNTSAFATPILPY